MIVTASKVAAIPETEFPERFGGTELKSNMMFCFRVKQSNDGHFRARRPKEHTDACHENNTSPCPTKVKSMPQS